MSFSLAKSTRSALIALVAIASTAGATVPLRFVTSGRVRAGWTNTHFVSVGLSDNYVTVLGDGDTDLDCWIYDQSGALVDQDTDATDFCVLSTPGLGRHRLVITNYGDVYNNYVVRKGETL
jgi:hypothetical protein